MSDIDLALEYVQSLEVPLSVSHAIPHNMSVCSVIGLMCFHYAVWISLGCAATFLDALVCFCPHQIALQRKVG